MKELPEQYDISLDKQEERALSEDEALRDELVAKLAKIYGMKRAVKIVKGG